MRPRSHVTTRPRRATGRATPRAPRPSVRGTSRRAPRSVFATRTCPTAHVTQPRPLPRAPGTRRPLPPTTCGITRRRRAPRPGPDREAGPWIRSLSGAGQLDRDGDGIADGVAHGRVARQASELGELIVVEVPGSLEGHSDLLEAGPNGLVEAEE